MAKEKGIPVVINHDEGEILVQGVPKHFAPKQYELLRTLVSANGKIVSRETLLGKMYDDASTIDERAVDQIVCRLRKILGKTSGYLKTVGNRGYKWSTR